MPSQTRPETFHLRIIATSDLHLHLLPFDYFKDQPTRGLGLAALHRRIEDLRRPRDPATTPDSTILVDNGDLLQGTPLEEYLARIMDRSQPHPVARLMNNLGYAALGLGNHDFDFGVDYLRWFARDLDAPLVCSNLVTSAKSDWLNRFTLHHTSGPVVGIVSALPPSSLTGWQVSSCPNLTASGIVDSVTTAAQQARDAGADIILCLAHSGLADGTSDNVVDRLAESGALDALVGGHTHLTFPSPQDTDRAGSDLAQGQLHGVPTILPGAFGAFLGKIDLHLHKTAQSVWQVQDSSGALIEATDDQDSVGSAFEPVHQAHAATRAYLNRNIARIEHPLTSYFSLVTPTHKQALSAAAQRAAIDAVRQGTEYANLPLVSAVATPRAGGRSGPDAYTDIPAGPIKARDVAHLHVYTNLIWAVKMTASELREWLEKSAAVFSTISRARPGNLLNKACPVFDFDVIFGLTYEIDPTKPPRYHPNGTLLDPTQNRISNIRLDGQPIPADTEFLVATNSFRVNGGGRFPNLAPERAVLRPNLTASDVIRDHLMGGAPVARPKSWKFAAAASGAEVWYETGPGAIRHLHEITHLSPGQPKPLTSGFLRIPLTL